MTAGPSGVNETLSERRFRPFASKTRELSGLGFRLQLNSKERLSEPQAEHSVRQTQGAVRKT